MNDIDQPNRLPLNKAVLEQSLISSGSLWTKLEVLDQVDSTNTAVVKAASMGAAEGLVITAEQQSAGKGRLDRQWLQPPQAGIAVSMLLRPNLARQEREWTQIPTTAWAWLPLLVGVALARTMKDLGGVEAHLKWPNDLLLGTQRQKAAGILAEAVNTSGVVVGIGLNVTTQVSELPRPDATSLQLVGANCIDRTAILQAVLSAIADDYTHWRAHAGDAQRSGLRAAYLQLCATIGQRVRVELPAQEPLVGLATGIDQNGRLLVENTTGQEIPIAAGDVIHVR